MNAHVVDVVKVEVSYRFAFFLVAGFLVLTQPLFNQFPLERPVSAKCAVKRPIRPRQADLD